MVLSQSLTKIDRDATPTEILEAANLNWQVEKFPRYYKNGSDFHEVPGKYSLVRTDTMQELDVCSSRWQEQQNSDIVTLAYESLKEAGLKISYAGALRGGKGVAIVADWKQTTIGQKSSYDVDDIVESKILIIGSHKVGVGHKVKAYHERLVCTNGMTSQVVLNRKVIGHTPDAIDIMITAIENAEKSFTQFERTANKLSKNPIERVEAHALLIKQFGEQNKPISEQPKIVKTVLNLFDGKGKGQDLLSAYQTAWGLLNGLTEYYSHLARSSERFNSIAQGSAYQNTQQFQNSLLNYIDNRSKSQVKVPVSV